MSIQRLLLVAALAIPFAFAAADMILNRPAQTIVPSTSPVLINSDPSFPIHQWTVPGPGGDWGLVGFSQARYRPRSTDVRFGSSALSFGFSIYAVAGFAACAVLLAGGLAALAFCRDDQNAANQALETNADSASLRRHRSALRSANMAAWFRLGASVAFIILICVLATACKPQYKNLTPVELRRMTPFKARVDRVTLQEFPKDYGSTGVVAVVWLKTDDRQRFALGGVDPSREMLGFLQSFNAGQSYTFPQVLLDYEERSGKTLK